ncbi:MAG: NAD(P)-dependent oxidoreductase [Candidatus Kaiserbacteria bacterium]|nr:NAD(P)-dependent oxidoreductase [Candidatus Kaiserbacteria bacterium]
MANDLDTSRRAVVSALGAGLAATAASSGSAGAEPAPRRIVGDPTTKYPKGPFPQQHQAYPGLASKMNPRPDHGETSYHGSGRLAGRKALITGGDSGIGCAAAIAFAREGADVAITYLPVEEPDAREVVALIQRAGRKAVALPGDLRSRDFCRQVVDGAASGLGGLDILVNAAGRQHSVDAIADLSDQQFDDTFKINVYALFYLCKAVLPHFKAGAAIINTTSVEAYDPDPNIIDYAATKAAIMNFTKSLAKQVGKKGIRVNAVAPGPVWTPLQISGGQSEEKLKKFGLDTPLGRPAQPAELAPLYVVLASDENSYSTGQVYAAVGGRGGP